MSAQIPAAAQQVAQVAQQQMPKPEAQPKVGDSKFDAMMANRADATRSTQQVQQATHASQVARTGKVDETAQARSVRRNAPVSAKRELDKARNSIASMLTQIENRNAAMGEFVNGALSGKFKLNQQQLLGLQAKVSEYALELDLTGKVVEKATNGLKDTLKTQV